MSSSKLSDPPKEQSPTPSDVTDILASDLTKEERKRRKGRSSTLLTKGQATSNRAKSLLGKSSNPLG